MHARIDALYSRAIAPWWDAHAGMRAWRDDGEHRTAAVIGISGLVPYKIEVDADIAIDDAGITGAGIELAYDTLLTNRLIAASTIEAEWRRDARDVNEAHRERTHIELGLRMRCEITRRIAPYIGLARARGSGAAGEAAVGRAASEWETQVVAGVAAWF